MYNFVGHLVFTEGLKKPNRCDVEGTWSLVLRCQDSAAVPASYVPFSNADRHRDLLSTCKHHQPLMYKSSLTNFYEISPGYFFETPEDLRDKPYNMKMQVKFVMSTARDSFLVCAEAAIPNHFSTITAHCSLHLLLTSEQ